MVVRHAPTHQMICQNWSQLLAYCSLLSVQLSLCFLPKPLVLLFADRGANDLPERAFAYTLCLFTVVDCL